MRSPSNAWIWLLRKEARELMASRSWWVFFVIMGPLVGVSFISAARTYAELSGLGGTTAGVGEAFSPLIGIWAPTFSACELAAAFLLPFVAIRLVAGDRQSGALKLESQHPLSASSRITVKVLVLIAGWLLAMLAPFLAVILWSSYGGSIYWPEVLTVTLGHILNAGLTIALATAAASVAEHPSTAAIITLTFTVGTWIINFIAAVHGAFWQQVADYTPTAMVAEFQHGLLRLDTLLIASVFIIAGLLLAAIWTRIGLAVRRRALDSVILAALTALIVFACTFIHASWDTSESRMNSFSRSDEAALRQIHSQVEIEVHLAAEDPRRSDLDHRVLDKLRRILPKLSVHYISGTSVGLFEQSNPNYGEIWYTVNGKKAASRAITPEAVLDTIYSLAGITPQTVGNENEFRGHPLAIYPRYAAWLFYFAWPILSVVSALNIRRLL